MASGIIVEKEEWEHATEEQRSWMVFKTLNSINGRLQTLEKKSFINKAWSAAGGVIGGAIAAISFKLWGS